LAKTKTALFDRNSKAFGFDRFSSYSIYYWYYLREGYTPVTALKHTPKIIDTAITNLSPGRGGGYSKNSLYKYPKPDQSKPLKAVPKTKPINPVRSLFTKLFT
jgi:hypothetical protein